MEEDWIVLAVFSMILFILFSLLWSVAPPHTKTQVVCGFWTVVGFSSFFFAAFKLYKASKK